ncbi:MAG: hypothetical protein K2Y27_05780 [Xanthobacteraceae bacterium]|nr:hypothetical protein [Xanthobacteraceae bacterium]
MSVDVSWGVAGGCIRALAVALCAGAALAASDRAHAAGAAYQVDTAEVSEPGSCKVESWVSSANNRDLIASVAPACVFNLGRPVELSSQVTRFRIDDEWGTGAAPKVKMNIVPTSIGSWGVAFTAIAFYDLIARENVGTAVNVPATLRVSNVLRFNLNAGYLRDRIAQHDYFTYGAGFDLRTPDNVWTLTGEVFGQAGAADDTRGPIEPRFQLGLRWRPVDLFNIDLIYGRNLAGERADWITLATIVRFKPQDR